MTTVRWMLRLMVACAGLCSGVAQGAYSCNVYVTDLGVIYRQGNAVRTDATGAVTLTCTRDVATDGNSLTYLIGADNGDYYNGGDRRARRGAFNSYITYTLTRGAAPATAAACSDTNNWGATLATVMSGTLNFGTAATASATWSYCFRVRGNQGNPTAGVYVDNVDVYAYYPAGAGGALTAPATVTYTIGARNQCVFNSFPADMAFNYNSFQATPQTTNQTFHIACSNNLPWSVAISPASGTLLGLNYTLTSTPTTGSGNGNPQTITITGSMPANQQGICATAPCTGSQAHTVTVTY